MNKHTVELLEQHFDTAFAAPDGIKKLRELILTLAMQGKLVPQDPNDQPASELLKEIDAEKQRLVKEGKIKKPKPLPPVSEEEEPYALPQGWKWVRLRNICHDWGQKVPDSHFTYIDVSAIDNKSGRISEAQTISASDAPSRARKIVRPGDVIYSTVRPYLLNVAIVDREYDPAPIASTAFAVLHPYSGISNSFVFRYLRSPIFISYVEQTQKGVAYPAINDGDFFSGLFPLAPLAEQRRIVAKIDELMARCDELEKLRATQQEQRLTVHAAAIKQLLNIAEPDQHQRAQAFLAEHFGELYTVKENVAELRKAILQLAVMGKLVPQDPNDQPASELLKKIDSVKRKLEVEEGLRTSAAPFVSQSEEIYGKPEGWSYCRLGNIGKFIDYRGRTPKKVEAGVPLITAKNVRFGYINREPREYITSEEYDRWMTRGFPRIGDILFTTEAPLGNVAIIDIEEKFALAQRVICLQLHMPEIAVWLKNFMVSDSFQERLLSEATGMTATGIKASKLKEMPIPLPPLAEQRRIVIRIDQLMALCDTLDRQIEAVSSKQAELLNALVHAQSQAKAEPPVVRPSATITNLADYRAAIGCYTLGKLANAQYFGRTAAAKVLYLAQAHVGLELNLQPEREAAGPLDKWIYDFEREGQDKHWFEVSEKTLTSGHQKTEYRCLPALAAPASRAESVMAPVQKAEFDRLIHALADKTTEEVEIIATLFAVWNDFLIDGTQPTDEQIITDLRENWHQRKARFTSAKLGQWLDWLRKDGFVPRGLSPRTIQQQQFAI